MFESIADILRQYPTLALFLTVGLGFFIGRLRIGSFSLGSVTAVLLTGILIGQLDINVDGPLKMVFFMMFLVSIGYSVGPDFFRSLRGQGARQALFAVAMSSMCFITTIGISMIMGYNKGQTVGLFSGSQTCSALLGVGSEAIARLGLPPAETDRQIAIIPVCYAVTYIFGTLGTIIILGNFGPKMLGGVDKVHRAAKSLERKLGKTGRSNDPASVRAGHTVVYRAYRVENGYFATPRTVREAENYFRQAGRLLFVDRMRHDGEICVPRHDQMIAAGDDIVLCGDKHCIIGIESMVGPEIAASRLLSYRLRRVEVVVAKKDFIGLDVAELRRKPWMEGVVIREAVRGQEQLPVYTDSSFRRADRLTLVGRPANVREAARHIGHLSMPSFESDLMFVGLAIFIGGLFGAICIWVKGIPVSFGTSGGALAAGLVFGWLRSKRPTYGHIPGGALWFMNNMGLNVFAAVIGLQSGSTFVQGLIDVGPTLFIAGAVGTTVPLLFGLWLGHKVFRFNPAITLGCCAGTRTCTASLGAVQDTIRSNVPTIGYTVTYAVSNILLVVWGMLAVAVM